MKLNGKISTTPAKIYTCGAQPVSVESIRFNNPVAYNVTLSKFDKQTNQTIELYTLNLDAGDTVTDTFPYPLSEGDSLIASASVAKTTYSLVIK